MNDLGDKWRSLGFCIIDVDGHDINKIINALKVETDRPKVIIANTIKGKGLSFAENKGDWHYKMPSEKEIQIGLQELGMTMEDLQKNAK